MTMANTDRIDPADLALFQAARTELSLTQKQAHDALARARGALAFVGRTLQQKYDLGPQDTLDTETGVITRRAANDG